MTTTAHHYLVYDPATIDFTCTCGYCDNYKGFFHADRTKLTTDVDVAKKFAKDTGGVLYAMFTEGNSWKEWKREQIKL